MTTLNLPYGCVWPGWPKIPKSYWEARPKENHRENGGGSSAQIFPQTSPQRSLEKNKSFLLFPKVFGESSGVKSWLKTPIFPMVSFGGDQVPKFYLDDPPPGHQKFGDLLRGPLGPKFGRRGPPRPKVTIGKLGGFQPRFSPELSPKNFGNKESAGLKALNLPVVGELWGKILVENPHFPCGFLWPGSSEAHIPKIYGEAAPGPPKIWWLARVPLGPKFPISIGRRRPPKPPRPKVTIGKLGGGSSQIFPRALPKEFWQQRKCWLSG